MNRSQWLQSLLLPNFAAIRPQVAKVLVFSFIALGSLLYPVCNVQAQLSVTLTQNIELTSQELIRSVQSLPRINPLIVVLEILNATTQLRDEMSQTLEQDFAEKLAASQTYQVVEFQQISSVREEWLAAFPDSQPAQLRNDLADVVGADWVVTGSYTEVQDTIEVRLQLYEVLTQQTLWQGGFQTNLKTPTSADSESAIPITPPKPVAIPITPTLPGTIPSDSISGRDERTDSENVSEGIETESNETMPTNPAGKASVSEELKEDPVQPIISGVDTEASETETDSNNIGTEPFGSDGEIASIDSRRSESDFTEAGSPLAQEFVEDTDGMILIPSTTFIIGSETGDADERPVQTLSLPSYRIDANEVTNADFAACPVCERGQGGFDTEAPDQPVVYVDWENARKYCEFVGKRLPTEAEWENAARAGNQTQYAFGDDVEQLGLYAWHQADTLLHAQPVRTKQPNQWGIFDMHGNVMEWVSDRYDASGYRETGLESDEMPESSSVEQPPEEATLEAISESPSAEKNSVLSSPVHYLLRSVRGGAWGGAFGQGKADQLRSANREGLAPWVRSFLVGFRCAADAPVSPPIEKETEDSKDLFIPFIF